MVGTTIEEVIQRMDSWKGKDVSYFAVEGGITNPNYKVSVNGINYFVKIPGKGTAFIDRNVCHEANVIASETGTGPEEIHFFPDTGVEIVRWLDGFRQVEFGDVYKRDIFNKIIEAASKFHNVKGKKISSSSNLIKQAWDMRERAKKCSYQSPYDERMCNMLDRIETALMKADIQSKPCHNDFWTNNLMYSDEEEQIKIIDYEYASMGDPCADLGTLSTINYFTEAMDVEMMKIYNKGSIDEQEFARMKLYKIVSDIKWAYWALVQKTESDIDFDYMNWYGIKMARLQHLWLDPRLEYWLGLLEGRDIFERSVTV